MDAKKAHRIEKDFEAYSKSRDESVIKKYSLKDLRNVKGYLHKRYGNMPLYEDIKTRIAYLEKRKTWLSHPAAIYVISAIVVFLSIVLWKAFYDISRAM